MKIGIELRNCKVITKKEFEFTNDVTKKYYKLGLKVGDELGELSCTKDIYDVVAEFKDYSFLGSVDTESGKLRLVSFAEK